MTYRLLAMDLDDTILPREGNISERSRAAIHAAQTNGIMVTIASGRTFGAVSRFAHDLGIALPVITHQGALVKDTVTGQVLHEDLLPLDIVRDVVRFCRAHDLHLNVYFGDDTFMEKGGPEFGLYSAISRGTHSLTPDLMAVLDRRPTKFIVVSMTPERTEITMPLMKAAFSDRVSILRSHPILIEGVMPTVSKGLALSILADHLDVLQEETAAIGDSENDIDMLRWAGLGLAMGNAAPEVQAAADCVLPPIWEEGAAFGIEHYILNGVTGHSARAETDPACRWQCHG